MALKKKQPGGPAKNQHKKPTGCKTPKMTGGNNRR